MEVQPELEAQNTLNRKPVGLIVAVGINTSTMTNYVIGSKETATGLPQIEGTSGASWKLTRDMRLFAKITKEGGIVVMGSVTAEALLAQNYFPLPGRENIIISRNPLWGSELGDTVHFHRASNLYDALSIGQTLHGQKIWIIGGAQTYYIALTSITIDTIMITTVFGNFIGDSFFPMEAFNTIKDLYEVQLESYISQEADIKNTHTHSISTYQLK